MANLPADLPTNWTQGQIISPNGTEVGLSEQHGYNYLNEQVNATQTEVNGLSAEVSNLSTEVAGAASQTSVDNISNSIGTTTDRGATSTTGTLMGKANAILENLESGRYYFSTEAKENLVSKQYSVTSSKKCISLGQWTAKRNGVITIRARFWSNTGGEAAYFYVFCGKTSNLSFFDANVVVPLGSYITKWERYPTNFIQDSTDGNNKSYRYYTFSVEKGDFLVFLLGYANSAGYINDIAVCYADE